MYSEFFRLEQMPFANTADPTFFFKTAEHEEALAALLYGVTQRRGVVVVSGPPGTGKTLLAHMLVEQLRPQAQVALLLHTPESGHDLIASLCREFGIRHRSTQPTGELVERLRLALVDRFLEGKSVVAVIDEAQNLSAETLEHLRMLGNLEKENAKLLQIVLLGQPDLIEKLKLPQMQQLCQRVFCHRQLGPLARDQVRGYVRHRLDVAGARGQDFFTDDAMDLIHDRSGGLPRLINQIADNAMLAAYGLGRRDIDRELVYTCIKDMLGLQLVESAALGAEARPAAEPRPPAGQGYILASSAAPAPWPVAAMPPLPASDPGDSVRKGAEVAGRLAEINQFAQQQSGVLRSQLAQAESIITQIGDSRQSAVICQVELATRIGQINEVIHDADQLIQRLQSERVGAAPLADRLGSLVNQAEGVAKSLASIAPESARDLDAAIRKAQVTKDDVTRSFTELNIAAARADDLGGRLTGIVDEAGKLRNVLAEMCSVLGSRTSDTQSLLGTLNAAGTEARTAIEAMQAGIATCGDHTRELGERVVEADAATGRLDGHLRDLPPLLNACDESLAEMREQLEEAQGQIGQLRICGENARDEIRSLQDATRAVSAETVRAEAIRKSCAAENEHLQSILPQARTLNEELRVRQEALPSLLAVFEARTSELTGKLDDIPARVRELTSHREQADKAGQSAQAAAEAATAKVAEVEDLLATCQRRLDDLGGVLIQAASLAERLDEARESAAAACETYESQMTDLAARLERVPARVAALKEVCEEADARRQSLGALTEAADSRLSETRNLSRQVESQSETLLVQLRAMQTAGAELHELHATLKKTFSAETIRELEQTDAKMRASLSEAILREEGLRSTTEAAQTVQAHLTTTSDRAEELSGRLISATQEASNQAARTSTTAAECNRQADQMSQLLIEARQSLVILADAHTEAGLLDEEWGRRIALLAGENRQAVENIRELSEACHEASEAKHALSQRIIGSIRQLAIIQEQANRQATDTDRATNEAREALDNLVRMRDSLDEAFGPAVLADLEARRNRLAESIETAHRQSAELESTRTAVEILRQQVSESCKAAEERLADAVGRGDAMHRVLADATAAASAQSETVTQLSQRAEGLAGALGKQLDEAQAAQDRLDRLLKELVEGTIPQAIITLTQSREESKSAATEAARRCAELKAATEAAQESDTRLGTAIRDAGSARESLESASESLRGRMAEMREEVEQAMRALDARTARFNEHTDRASRRADEQITRLHEEAAQIAVRVGEQVAIAGDFSGKVDGLTRAMDERITEANGAVNRLTERADSHTKLLANEIGRAEALLAGLGRLQEEIAQSLNSDVVRDVENRRTDLNLAIADAASQTEALRNVLTGADARTTALLESNREAGERIEGMLAASGQARQIHELLESATAGSAEQIRAAEGTTQELKRLGSELTERIASAEAGADRLESLQQKLDRTLTPEVVQLLQEKPALLDSLLARANEEADRLTQAAEAAQARGDAVADNIRLAGQMNDALARALESVLEERGKLEDSCGQAKERLAPLQAAVQAGETVANRLGRLKDDAVAVEALLTRAGEQSKQLSAASLAADKSAAAVGDGIRLAGQINDQLARGLEIARDEASRLNDIRALAEERIDPIQSVVERANEASNLLGRLIERTQGLSQDHEKTLDAVTKSLDLSAEQLRQIEALFAQGPQMEADLTEQIKLAEELKREIERAARRLNRERQLADAAADRLHASRIETLRSVTQPAAMTLGTSRPEQISGGENQSSLSYMGALDAICEAITVDEPSLGGRLEATRGSARVLRR